ncbi:MAG: PAS domain-containing sensor histidine kinase [Candidatus Omnitrophica bacterium]|nr:PAS domain-containing sensor histidine kinase [Candidatus Omnitrophota bacterium]
MIHYAIKDKKTISSGETTIATKDKNKVPIGITTSLLKDKEDTLLGVVVTFKDLARIKHMEEQMRRADRLAALGSLAAGVAHEIRNPLGSVKGLAQLLREDLKEGDPKRGYTDVIVKEIDRLNKVVEELLSFARPEESHVESRAINEIIDDALQLAKHDASQSRIEIIRNYDKDLPYVSADSKKLQQAFLNIIFNAFHAMKEKGGQLNITTRLYEDPKFVEIRFQDTGPGIAPEHINRLFDPFFTTREDGTGLGLTITHQIIDSHGGRISVRSSPGKGASFSVCLPGERV